MNEVSEADHAAYRAEVARSNGGLFAASVARYEQSRDSQADAANWATARLAQESHPGQPCLWCETICKLCKQWGIEMDINSAFPGNYLKAQDVQGKHLKLIIDKVQMEDVSDDREKPVLYFTGKERGLVLNKTNANTLSDAFGTETESWHGKEMILYPAKTQFQGRMVDCLRIRVEGMPGDEPQAADEIPF